MRNMKNHRRKHGNESRAVLMLCMKGLGAADRRKTNKTENSRLFLKPHPQVTRNFVIYPRNDV